jgi:methionine synthase II (cobalamin-independent)
MATGFHAEHVGSLLRQPWLLRARAEHKQGKLSEAGLREVEDRAAAENIDVQRAAGIEVFTDGEVRRTNWMTGILESIGGMTEVETPAVTWHREDGEIPPTLESQEELRRRIDQAARYVPMENLAISPQCGFASTAKGNLLTPDEQKRKLALVADTARKVWG